MRHSCTINVLFLLSPGSLDGVPQQQGFCAQTPEVAQSGSHQRGAEGHSGAAEGALAVTLGFLCTVRPVWPSSQCERLKHLRLIWFIRLYYLCVLPRGLSGLCLMTAEQHKNRLFHFVCRVTDTHVDKFCEVQVALLVLGSSAEPVPHPHLLCRI